MHSNSLNQILNVPTSPRGSTPQKQLAARRWDWKKRPQGLTEGAKSIIHRHLQRNFGGFGDTKAVKQYVLIENLVHFWSGVSRKSRQPIRDFSEGKGDKKV
jgi:hypothetical protein